VGADEDDLANAAVLWTGRGTRSWPHRDSAALVREFGETHGLELFACLERLEADFYSSDAHLTEPDLQAMTVRASEQFRARHPGASPVLVDALAWCYSYDYQ
jgi:hypothetical protein